MWTVCLVGTVCGQLVWWVSVASWCGGGSVWTVGVVGTVWTVVVILHTFTEMK